METSNPTGFLEKQIREQLISKKWWSPYLYRRGKNLYGTKLGWVCFLTCVSHLCSNNTKTWTWKTELVSKFGKQFTRLKTNQKALGFVWQVLKWNSQLSKPSWQRHHIILYMRARLKPGWVWRVFHFTFWVVVNFTRPKPGVFSRPFSLSTLDALQGRLLFS